MSSGNTLYDFAFRGCVAGAFLLAATALAGDTGYVPESERIKPEQQHQAQASSIKSKTVQPATLSGQRKAKPAEYKCPANDTDCYAREDLIAQDSMARSTEILVGLSRWQIGITSVEIFLILSALGVAFWATVEARRAADAANAQVAVASESTKHQLRAYVHIFEPELTFHQDGRVDCLVPIKNFGQTPARELKARGAMSIFDYPKTGRVIAVTQETEMSCAALAPSGSARQTNSAGPVSKEDRKKVRSGEKAVYVYGNITYVDVFGDPQTTPYRLFYRGPWEGVQPLKIAPEGNEAT